MNRQIVFPNNRTTRELRKRGTTEADGTEEIFYQVSVDLDGLDAMARKAASRSQSARAGPVCVRIFARARI